MTQITPESQSYLLSSPSGSGWKKVGVKNHHGINLPLFSLHTKKSAGIGEYLDLKLVIDWCANIGFDLIQILPINDTGLEPSPYSALSAFALNPLHISLSELPNLEKHSDLAEILLELQSLTKQQQIDYSFLHKKREEFLHLYYQYTYATESQRDEYLNFINNNSWLQGYALFKSLKIMREWQAWEAWPQEIRDPCPSDLKRLLEEYKNQIAYHIFLQYFCYQQMNEVRHYAESKGVFLKGDIPILINKESTDVWLNRNLFFLQLTAGAPPDMFSEQGQNWQFPIYNWEELEHQDYLWWRQRLFLASHLYHSFRLDHVVGFYRIWAVPIDKTGKEGKFFPEDEKKWIPLGEKNLSSMLKDSTMLPIGEDLGVVPETVRESLRKLGICGTKVMRWERNWNGDKSFIPVRDYHPLSMTTVSTHDSEPLALWWKNHPDESEPYAHSKGWKYAPEITLEQNIEILKESHQSNSLFHVNLLNEYLALIPELKWLTPEEERINDPSIHTYPNKNWTYRFRKCFEEISECSELKTQLASYASSSTV